MSQFEKLESIKAFIRTASMEDCQTIISELIERVSDEVGSAHHLEEAFSDLGMLIAIQASCECGKCDSCVAARSDEHYDRVVDGHLCDEE